MLKNAPQSFWIMDTGVPLALFISWSEIKLPALVVSEVTQKQTFAHAAVAVGVLIALTFAAAALQGFCSTVLEAYMSKYRYSQSLLIEQKSMSCFYQEYEKKSVRDLATRGSSATWMQNGKVPLCGEHLHDRPFHDPEGRPCPGLPKHHRDGGLKNKAVDFSVQAKNQSESYNEVQKNRRANARRFFKS